LLREGMMRMQDKEGMKRKAIEGASSGHI